MSAALIVGTILIVIVVGCIAVLGYSLARINRLHDERPLRRRGMSRKEQG